MKAYTGVPRTTVDVFNRTVLMSLSKANTPKLLVSLKSSQAIISKRPWYACVAQRKQRKLPKHLCIHHLFEQQVQQTPQAVAIATDNTQLTYQQLNRQANRLAYQLASLGIGPTKLVGLCVEYSIDMIVGLIATLKAGSAYVPIDPHAAPEKIKHILEDSQAKVLLTQTHLEDRLGTCLSHPINRLCLDRDQWIKMRSCPDLNIPVTAKDLMHVIYPSTNHPKKIKTTHSRAYHQLYQRQTQYPLTSQDRILQNPVLRSASSLWQIFWPLLAGSQLVILQHDKLQNIAALIEFMEEKHVSVIDLETALLDALLEQPKFRQNKSLQQILCSSESKSIDLQSI